MKKLVTSVLALTLAVASVSAAFAASGGPFYAKGSFYCPPGCWNFDTGNQMFATAGVWTGAVATDQVAGGYLGKVAVADWSESYPHSNQTVFVSSPGEIVTWTLDTNVHGDGWLPNTDIAMNDHAIPAGTTFEVIGAAPETGSWGSGVAMSLVGDIWSVEIPIATPGYYEVKYRKTGDWGLNVGTDGVGTNSDNANYTTTLPNEPVLFEFNQRTGRIRITVGGGVVPTQSRSWGSLKQVYR